MRKLITMLSIVAMIQPAFAGTKTEGKIKADGSSTVFPITEAVAEEFQKENPKTLVTVGISGTGGGMKKFYAGEIDIANASRPIKETERAAAEKNKVSFIELPVAYDGIAIVVHPKNDWAKTLTVDELKRIWQPGSNVKRWSDINSSWPKKEIHLYGPGADSGTFDYFTEAIVGKEKAIRPDFTASEDDNILVQGVSGDPHALGYFGFAYYEENASKLKLVSVDSGSGAIAPSPKTIEDETYKPLSRPIFIYVSNTASERPEVASFVRFYLKHAPTLVQQVGYVSLSPDIYAMAEQRFQKRMTGTVFTAEMRKKATSLKDLMAMKGE